VFAITSRDWESSGFTSHTLIGVSVDSVGAEREIGFFSRISILASSLK
jgi:hypothetical protein